MYMSHEKWLIVFSQALRATEPKYKITDLIQAINQLEKKRKSKKETEAKESIVKAIPYQVPQAVSSPGGIVTNLPKTEKAVVGE